MENQRLRTKLPEIGELASEGQDQQSVVRKGKVGELDSVELMAY